MGFVGQKIVKFFVTNLPDGCSSKDIGDAFCAHGEVVGIYIARKRDKLGNRFAFVSFAGVRNLEEMAANLKSVKMGNFTLKVNVARFATEYKDIKPNVLGNGKAAKVYSGSSGGGQTNHSMPAPSSHLGTTYRDMLVGGSKHVSSVMKKVEVSEFVKPFEEWVNRSLIVRMVDLDTLLKLDKLLVAASCSSIELKYVGGLYMLLVFVDVEEMLSFKDSNPNVDK
ncbi:putative RNA recognition motif domain, nucleotide-binding alpha-beta plait domain superfamily [Helianthus annuus]|nr:putative RNA recognition motif domain, nucleotide-binding alpha-beta plait domain superfamily [Helianthus annuus]